MTCCKNVWLSLKTNSAFKKAFKFQGKMLEAKKTNTLIEKTNLTTKNQ